MTDQPRPRTADAATGANAPAAGRNPDPRAERAARAAHAARVAVAQLATLRAWRGAPPDYVEIRIDGPLPALPPRRPAFLSGLPLPHRPSMQGVLDALAAVARDPRVTGAVLHLRAPATQPAERDALAAAVRRTRAAGKRVVAYASNLDAATYPIACACDEIVLQPGGHVGVLGVRRGFPFLADSLARAGLAFEVVRVSPFKSAADLLTERTLSPEARQMVSWLLDDAFDAQVAAVAEGRGLTVETARARIDGAPYTDEEALALGLVDGIAGAEDLPARLGHSGDPAAISPWKRASRDVLPRPPAAGGPHVALIRIEGLIVDGESRARPPLPGAPLAGEARCGDATIVAEVRSALADDAVAAAVVWIDSPGGSSTASEAIASALERLAARKPVVAVMGSVAGSGGYYVATPAHRILAQPSTLTGSIGVVAGKFVTAGLLERLAVRREVVERGANAGLWDGAAGFTPEQRTRVEALVGRIYDVFVQRVARSRGMTAAEVEALSGGRVWTGRQAVGYGLVDALGGLDDGAAEARRRAGISARAPLVEAHAGRRPLGPAAAEAAAEAGRAAVGALVPAAAALDALLGATEEARVLAGGRVGVWLLGPVGRDA